MVAVDKAFQVSYKKGKLEFQVLVDFDVLEEYKKSQEGKSVSDILADTKIFKDQKKGELSSESDLREAFGDMGEEEILKKILLEGECQIPTAFLNKIREEKKVQIISYIVENAVNAQSKSKFSSSMIEAEVSKLKFNVDFRASTQSQAEEVVSLLKKVMPISMKKLLLKIKIPGEYCGNFYGPFRKLGKVTKETFDDSGCLHLHMEIVESKLDEVANFIRNNSAGEGEYHH